MKLNRGVATRFALRQFCDLWVALQCPWGNDPRANRVVLCYAFAMTTKKLTDVLRRVDAWPEAAQAELAELALEIDAELNSSKYVATPAELAGIDRGLKAASEGRVAPLEHAERLFDKHRPA